MKIDQIRCKFKADSLKINQIKLSHGNRTTLEIRLGLERLSKIMVTKGRWCKGFVGKS